MVMGDEFTLDYGKSKLLIDRYDVRESCFDQLILFDEVSGKTALTKSLYDKKKEELAGLDAYLRNKARIDNADKKELTEGRLKEIVILDESRKDMAMEVFDAKFLHDNWSNLKECYTQRASILKSLMNDRAEYNRQANANLDPDIEKAKQEALRDTITQAKGTSRFKRRNK